MGDYCCDFGRFGDGHDCAKQSDDPNIALTVTVPLSTAREWASKNVMVGKEQMALWRAARRAVEKWERDNRRYLIHDLADAWVVSDGGKTLAAFYKEYWDDAECNARALADELNGIDPLAAWR